MRYLFYFLGLAIESIADLGAKQMGTTGNVHSIDSIAPVGRGRNH